MVYSQPTLMIRATQSASYTCMAENVHVNGYTNVSSTAHIRVIGEYAYYWYISVFDDPTLLLRVRTGIRPSKCYFSFGDF